MLAGLLTGSLFVPGAVARAAPSSQCGYRLSSGVDPFVDISGQPGAVVLGAGSNALEIPVAFPTQVLPFPMVLPGGTLTQAFAWSNGAITDVPGFAEAPFGGTCSFPSPNPNTEGCSPGTIFAPWWGDLSVCTGASVTMLSQGNADAGQGVVTVQWSNVTDDQQDGCIVDGGLTPVSSYSFQAKLFQSGDVEYIYGPGLQSSGDECGSFEEFTNVPCVFASGIEASETATFQPLPAPTGGPALGCNSACASTDFPTAASNNFSVSLAIGPDLQATSLGAGANVSVGAAATFTANVENLGATPSENAVLTVYLSADGVTLGPQIGAPIPMQLEGCAPSQPFVGTFTVPTSGISPGITYLIGAISDADDSDPLGKSVVSGPFIVLGPEPNYVAQNLAVQSPAGTVAPGTQLTLGYTALNSGAAASAGPVR